MTHPHAQADWLAALTTAAEEGRFVKATITLSADPEIRAVDMRPIRVKREPKLSLTTHYHTRDIVKNYSAPEAEAILAGLLERCTGAKLYTTTANHHLKRHKAETSLTTSAPTHTAPPDMAHDRSKKRYLTTAQKPYLHALGLTDAKGNLLKAAQDKFRQINKYLEILDGLLPELPADAPLRIVDMGSGKGYLTFALYDYLTTTLGRAAQVTGVEARADMVQLCNDIAAAAEFRGLHFEQNTIASYRFDNPGMVIALHACDTATDDAIYGAIMAEAPLIVVAPCCHKQLRREQQSCPADHALHPMLKHGTYAERLAEMTTDAIRAELMEIAGYRTRLFEFIGGEHTPKNVMIVGIRTASARQEKHRNTHRQALERLKKEMGVTRHYLEERLAVSAEN